MIVYARHLAHERPMQSKMASHRRRRSRARKQAATVSYRLEIYHQGVVFTIPARDREQYLKERAFLDRLVGNRTAPGAPPRPVPDPSSDFYMLDETQLEAYAAFHGSD